MRPPHQPIHSQIPTTQGRPKSGPEDKFRLAPVAPRLSELLGQEVATAPDCVGPEVRALRESLAPGRALLLENVRFHKEETKNDLEFARQLAEGSDFYVNDAFGSAHRAHASTVGVTKFLSPNVAGLLLERELEYLGEKEGTMHSGGCGFKMKWVDERE